MATKAVCSRFSAISRLCQFPSINTCATRLCATLGVSELLRQPENLPPKRLATDDIFEDEQDDAPNISIRASSNNPTEHTAQDLFAFYTATSDVVESLQLSKIVREEFDSRTKALHEFSLMVREPALECLELMKSGVHKDLVAPKVLLYGKDGCGKSLTFAHSLHACHNLNWFVICPMRPYLWNVHFKEVVVSTRKPGRVDLPEEAVEFLSAVKVANKKVFSDFGDGMRTHADYTWSKREQTPSGTTIEELIDFGIERPKYAADAVGALLKEIRLHSHEWHIPTVLAIDGVNSLFGTTRMFTGGAERTSIPPSRISLIHNLIKLISHDWKNGFMLLSADVRACPPERRDSYQPRYLLDEEGFDALNPFVPIEVCDYSDEEIDKTFDYLIERGWIQNKAYRISAQARKELIFLSAKNPLFLDKVLRSV